VISEALDEAGVTFDQLDSVAVTQGLADRGAARRPLGRQGDRLVQRTAADTGRPPARHVSALYLDPVRLEPPFLCLLTSGGHTLLLDVQEHTSFRLLGTTLDDAAGEASTRERACSVSAIRRRGARPAGAGRRRKRLLLPIARLDGLDFSFSGLKTALLYEVRGLEHGELERRRADLAASYSTRSCAPW